MNTVKKLISVALCICLIITTAVLAGASGREFYIDAARGDDANSGTAAAPFKTVSRAVEKAEKDAVIHIRDGEYFFENTLSLTGANNNLTFVADGENVVFTGATALNDWKETTLAGVKCLRTEIGTSYSQVMLYDGIAHLVNSRLPDSGYFYLKDGADPTGTDPTFLANKAVITDTKDTAALAREDLSHSFLRIFHYWTEELLYIDSFNAADGRITFNQNFGGAASLNTAAEGDAYCFNNVLAGFNAAGEWYADYNAGILYYIPRTGETAENLRLSLGVTETLIEIDGATGITFDGITLRDTGWVYESNFGQSAYGSKSCLVVRNSSEIAITDCSFINIGASAVNLGDWHTGKVTSSSITGCLFRNIGASPVIVSGDMNEDCPSYITVDNNLIENYGLTRSQAAGVFVTNANNVSVTHNEIHRGGYTAVSVGWSWGYAETCNYNNTVSHNLIYDIGHIALSDMGGIYVLGIQTGSTMCGNVVYDVTAGPDASTYGGWGLYTDEGSVGWTICHNTVYDCGSQGFHQHYGRYNVVEYNIFAFNEEGQVRSSTSKCPPVAGALDEDGSPARYSYIEDGSQFTLRKNILVGDNQNMYQNLTGNRFTDDTNCYWDYMRSAHVKSEGKYLLTRGAVKIGFKYSRYNNGVFEDPCFTDAKNRNFTLSADSDICEKLGTDELKPDYSDVGSEKFGSRYFINDFTSPLSSYSADLIGKLETARAEALNDRTDETVAVLSDAYNAVASADAGTQTAEKTIIDLISDFIGRIIRYINAVFGGTTEKPAC